MLTSDRVASGKVLTPPLRFPCFTQKQEQLQQSQWMGEVGVPVYRSVWPIVGAQLWQHLNTPPSLPASVKLSSSLKVTLTFKNGH